MRVPMLDLAAQHAPIRAELDEAIRRVMDRGHFILGAEVERFEAEVASYLGVRYAIGVSSGTDALLVALMALDIGPGDEVITTPFSFFATAGAIARVGALPVFVDVEDETLNIDPSKIGAAVTSRTRAILPVHLYGQCAEMTRINEIADTYQLHVVEDAAQALGSRCRSPCWPKPLQPWLPAGRCGDLACFSFYPSKNLGATGDAGLVTTDDPALAKKVRTLRSHGSGSAKKYDHTMIGGNFRMDELQAAVLRVKLPHVETWNDRRRANAATYDACLEDADLRLPTVRPHNVSNVHHYTVRVGGGRRDAVRSALVAAGIETAVYYPTPLHLQPCFQYLKYRRGDFPVAEAAADEVLSLPVSPETSEDAVRYVAETLKGELTCKKNSSY